MRAISVQGKGKKQNWQSENCNGDSAAGMAPQSCALLESRG